MFCGIALLITFAGILTNWAISSNVFRNINSPSLLYAAVALTVLFFTCFQYSTPEQLQNLANGKLCISFLRSLHIHTNSPKQDQTHYSPAIKRSKYFGFE
jgi:O-antigen ligase